MKIACLFDGLKLVQNIKNKDVSATVLFSARTSFFLYFCLACSLCCLFICSLVLSTGRPNTCTNWCFITTISVPIWLGLLCCKTWSSSWAWAPRHSVRSLYRLLRRDGVARNRCAGLLPSSPKTIKMQQVVGIMWSIRVEEIGLCKLWKRLLFFYVCLVVFSVAFGLQFVVEKTCCTYVFSICLKTDQSFNHCIYSSCAKIGSVHAYFSFVRQYILLFRYNDLLIVKGLNSPFIKTWTSLFPFYISFLLKTNQRGKQNSLIIMFWFRCSQNQAITCSNPNTLPPSLLLIRQ